MPLGHGGTIKETSKDHIFKGKPASLLEAERDSKILQDAIQDSCDITFSDLHCQGRAQNVPARLCSARDTLQFC